MRQAYYKLIGHDPVPCGLWEWAALFEMDARCVAFDRVMSDAGEAVKISTVFLGLDHNHAGFGEPILFETMVFGGVLDGWQWRYGTWEEAEAGHAQVLALARQTEVIEEGGSAAALAAQVIARTRMKASQK